MRFGRFRIDRERLILEHGGSLVALPPKSVELLAVLAERPGELFTKRELLDRLWPQSSVEEANLSQHVYLIRKTLAGCDPTARESIVTIPKRGYRFVSPHACVNDRELPGLPAAAVPAGPRAADGEVRLPPATARRIESLARRWVVTLAAAFIAAILATAAVPHRRFLPPPLGSEGSTASRLGRYYLDLRTPTGIGRSRTYFARVIASDPRNPAGYAGLADALTMTADYDCGRLPRMTYVHWAQHLAHRAALLDPSSAAAHASLGIVAHYLHDDRTAESELHRSIALDPGYAPAHHWLGTMLFDAGAFGPSLHELTIAAQLNPMSTASNAWLSIAAYFEHRYDTAIEHGRRALELDPARSDSLRELGLAYAAKGDYRSALVMFERIPRTSSAAPLVPLLIAAVYAHWGQGDIARRIVAQQRRRHVVNSELPFTLLALGETQAAAQAAARVRPHDCLEQRRFTADPRFDGVRGSAAFGGVFGKTCAAPD